MELLFDLFHFTCRPFSREEDVGTRNPVKTADNLISRHTLLVQDEAFISCLVQGVRGHFKANSGKLCYVPQNELDCHEVGTVMEDWTSQEGLSPKTPTEPVSL